MDLVEVAQVYDVGEVPQPRRNLVALEFVLLATSRHAGRPE